MSADSAGPSGGGKILQWVAITFTAIGLLATIHFHMHSLQTARIENELFSYLHLNDRYHKLIFTLLEKDANVFQKTDDAYLNENKFLMYELFELFSTADSLKSHFQELNTLWPHWQKRMEFLFSKPAIQCAWKKHQKSAPQIYDEKFITQVNGIIEAQALPSEVTQNQ
ncbi:MAG: hypothetical protein JSR58_02440 [Verrucomicrobia bacterium]|nr:hypothetical protein [Verrucomicrobiota bacterium]